MTHEIRHEQYAPLGGMAHVIYRDGECVGAAMTRAGAEESAAMIARFGYFDPTEARQRAALREMAG